MRIVASESVEFSPLSACYGRILDNNFHSGDDDSTKNADDSDGNKHTVPNPFSHDSLAGSITPGEIGTKPIVIKNLTFLNVVSRTGRADAVSDL